MATIKPFQGYRPPSDMAGSVSSPPYDVMTSDEARDMVQGNPDSFLRVIKPEIDFTPENEPKGDSLHEHGFETLQRFINDGKLVQDKNPCLYIYQIYKKYLYFRQHLRLIQYFPLDDWNIGKMFEYILDWLTFIFLKNLKITPGDLDKKNDKEIAKILNDSEIKSFHKNFERFADKLGKLSLNFLSDDN